MGRTNRLLSFATTRTAYKTTRPTILLLLPVYFFAVVLFLPIRCLAMIGDTHIDTQTDGRDL
jgi:hypothetical protein